MKTIDLDAPTITTQIAARIVGSDADEIQRWVSSGKLPATESAPGRGKSRMFTPNEVIGFALRKRITALGIPSGLAARLVSDIDLSIQAAEIAFELGAMNAKVSGPVRFALITVGEDGTSQLILKSTFSEIIAELQNHKTAVFIDVKAIQHAVLSRIEALSPVS